VVDTQDLDALLYYRLTDRSDWWLEFGLLAYWKLDETEGEVAQDSAENARVRRSNVALLHLKIGVFDPKNYEEISRNWRGGILDRVGPDSLNKSTQRTFAVEAGPVARPPAPSGIFDRSARAYCTPHHMLSIEVVGLMVYC
jgi:hypothetical protein